jgi:hypothetical protein
MIYLKIQVYIVWQASEGVNELLAEKRAPKEPGDIGSCQIVTADGIKPVKLRQLISPNLRPLFFLISCI